MRCYVVLSVKGSRQEVGTQVSYFTRGGRVIERKTTTRRFPGGGIQTETTERDVGPDTGESLCVHQRFVCLMNFPC